MEHGQLVEGRRALRGGGFLTAEHDPRAFYEAGYTKHDAAEAERLGRVGLRVAGLVEGACVVQSQDTAV